MRRSRCIRGSDRSRAEVARSLGVARWFSCRVGEGSRARRGCRVRSIRMSVRSSSGCGRRTRICGWIARSCGRRPRISRGRRTGEPQVRLRALRQLSGDAALRARCGSPVELSASGAAGRCRTTTSTTRGSRTRSTTSMWRRVAPTGHRRVAGQLHNRGRHHGRQAGRSDHGRVRLRRRARPQTLAARQARHRARGRSAATRLHGRAVEPAVGRRHQRVPLPSTASCSSPASRTCATKAWRDGRWANVRPPTSS